MLYLQGKHWIPLICMSLKSINEAMFQLQLPLLSTNAGRWNPQEIGRQCPCLPEWTRFYRHEAVSPCSFTDTAHMLCSWQRAYFLFARLLCFESLSLGGPPFITHISKGEAVRAWIPSPGRPSSSAITYIIMLSYMYCYMYSRNFHISASSPMSVTL